MPPMPAQTTPTDDQDFIDTPAVAALLDVTPNTVARWRTQCRAQPLPFFRVGGRRLYRRADVLAFVEAGRRKPGEAR